MTDQPDDDLVDGLKGALISDDPALTLAKHYTDTPITPAQARAAMGLAPIPDNSWQPDEEAQDGGGLRGD